MDDFTKNVILMQISLMKQQLAALESVVLAASAPKYEKPPASQGDARVLSERMDKEIGDLFEQLKPNVSDSIFDGEVAP